MANWPLQLKEISPADRKMLAGIWPHVLLEAVSFCRGWGKTHRMWQGYRYRIVCTFCHKHLLLSGRKKKNQNPKLWVINLSSNLYCARFRGCVRLCLLSKLPCTGSWELLALSKDKAEMERYPSLGITGKRSSSSTLPKRGLCEHCCRNSLSFG